MGVFQNNLLAGAAAAASAGGAAFYDHQIEQSVRFDRASNSYMQLSNSDVSGNRRYFTLSVWLKRSLLYTSTYTHQGIIGGGPSGLEGSSGYSGTILRLSFNNDSLFVNSQETNMSYDTAVKFRDTSGWMHIEMSGNNGTGIVYINGTQHDSFSFDGGADTAWNHGYMVIGTMRVSENTYYQGGYMAEMMMISHSTSAGVLTPSSFAETKNGVWVPKDISGLSNQDFYLKFENANDLGNDSSGNNRDFTVYNMGPDHQVLDSPTFGS